MAERTRARRWWRSARLRAVLGLGMVLGFGGVGTLASWSYPAPMKTGAFVTGKMDLQFDTSGAAGLSTGYDDSARLTWTGFIPGQQQAFPLTVRDVGNAAFHYTATIAQGSPWGYADNALFVQLYAGSVSGTGCTGTPLTSGTVTATSSPSSVIPAARGLSAGGSEPLCVVVGLSGSAANADQGKSGTLVLGFAATQDPS